MSMVLNSDPGNVKENHISTNKPPVRTVTLSFPPGYWPNSCRRWLRFPIDPREQLSHEMEGLGVWELPLCVYLYHRLWNSPKLTMHACVFSCFSRIQLFETPRTVAHQASLSMGFSRHEEYSGGLPFPLLQGIFPTQGSNSHLLHCTWILYHWATRGAPN